MGVLAGIVLADAGYGHSIDFREGLSTIGLSYCGGAQLNTGVGTKERMPCL